jgi:hypothetical protein
MKERGLGRLGLIPVLLSSLPDPESLLTLEKPDALADDAIRSKASLWMAG